MRLLRVEDSGLLLDPRLELISGINFGLKEKLISNAAWSFLRIRLQVLDRNRELDLTKIRGLGFGERLENNEGHHLAYERMVTARVIPPQTAMKLQ